MGTGPAWKQFYRGYVPKPSLEEVGDGIYAYIQHDGSWGLNNAGFVVRGDDCAVVDTCLTEGRTRALREEVRARGVTPTVLVNTHHHSDHTYGNCVFADCAIVAHERCREAVIEDGLAAIDKDPAVPWGDLELRPPVICFEDRLRLHVDDCVADLLYVGPAHTSNDVVVWLPEAGVLFAGDVLFNDATPIIWQGSLRGSIEALRRIEDLGPQVIVPGHGKVCGPEVLDDWHRYFRFLADTAQQAYESGASALDVARETDLGEFADWQHPERLVINLHRAMAELDGVDPAAPLDYARIFDEMMQLGSQAYGHRLIEGWEEYVR